LLPKAPPPKSRFAAERFHQCIACGLTIDCQAFLPCEESISSLFQVILPDIPICKYFCLATLILMEFEDLVALLLRRPSWRSTRQLA
jgi:hypothetical protein